MCNLMLIVQVVSEKMTSEDFTILFIYTAQRQGMFFNIFPLQMYDGANLILQWKGQRSTHDHHLNKLGWPRVPDTKIQPQTFLGSWEEDF